MSASKTGLTGDEVKAARAAFSLTADGMAAVVGLSDGAAWRKWERNGVKGPGAVLLSSLIDSPAVRRHFGLSVKAG